MQQSSPQSFAEYLRELRHQRKMNLKDVSNASGITLARLMALESGAGTPNRQELRRLARVFHMYGEAMLLKAQQLRLVLD